MSEQHEINGDQTLVLEAVAGNQAALEQLLLARHDRLFAKLNRRMPRDLRGELGPEDLLQEVFVAAFQNISQFQPQTNVSFDRWLARIATRKLISQIRHKRAIKRGGGRQAAMIDPGSPSQAALNLLDIVAVHESTPSRSAARREALRALDIAFNGINDDYRRVIQLRFIEGLTVEQTAKQMSRTRRAVEMLCHRALRRLRDDMGSASQFLSSRG